jgi:hypothetical protein
VVTGLVVPEVELEPVDPDDPVDPDEVVEPDDPDELVDPVEPVEPDELVEPVPVELVVPEAVVPEASALVFDSAGSCPVTNWTNSTTHTSANTTAAVAITRFRIRAIWRRCAPRRSAGAWPGCGRAAAAGARTGLGYVDPSEEVIVTSVSFQTRWRQHRPAISERRENRISPK